MSQSPQACHDLQRVVWDNIVAVHGYPEGFEEGKDTDAIFNQPFHHLIPLQHAIRALLKADPLGESYTITAEKDQGYDRTKFTLTSKAYMNVDDGKKKEVRSVDISHLVYPSDTTFITMPKKGESEDEKAAKTPIKTEANIPVSFVADGKSQTRHYQEGMPAHAYPGMTNRLLDSLPQDILDFLLEPVRPVVNKSM